MKCEEIGGLLPDYLHGNLNQEQGNRVEEHLGQCAECRDEVSVWEKLGLLPVEQPSAASRARFEAMLHAYRTGRAESTGPAEPRARVSFWDAFRWLRSARAYSGSVGTASMLVPSFASIRRRRWRSSTPTSPLRSRPSRGCSWIGESPKNQSSSAC